MHLPQLWITMILVTLASVSACGGDNLSLCEGCQTPSPISTVTPTATTPTPTTVTPTAATPLATPTS